MIVQLRSGEALILQKRLEYKLVAILQKSIKLMCKLIYETKTITIDPTQFLSTLNPTSTKSTLPQNHAKIQKKN